ncbi:MAG: glutamine synthetase III [Paludibacteraceae bacterium]|nr:glutamine synthetase III [Paludibacteraceae bacterium]
MFSLRFKAVNEAFNRKAVETNTPQGRTSSYFGSNVFDKAKMHQYLSKETVDSIETAVAEGKALSREIADQVAAGMMKWALEMGATHYTHWFQPLTEGTAEKHDSFIEYGGKNVIEQFSGKLLAQQEPDASSFPNGGIRNTFEARGYTAWDPSSPAFIVGDTLCIPTIFISYTGESLDYKTPLLKSISAIDRYATEVCRYFDPKVKKVYAYLGWEQEYFLVDESLFAARPDLMMTDRTLMGHQSAKNQQLDDHYFGAIPNRVTAFMQDLEFEAYKFGIPLKTRHNEVAPNQFEFAPIYGEMNLANDQNQLIITLMRRIASKHHFRVLLHEKPFNGVNGSGKHNNWSIGTDTGVGLLTPGKTAEENLQFVTFLVNVLMAVYKNNALLKASIMTAQNEHRLGANEAPPAIISVFLGSQLSNILDTIEKSDPQDIVLSGKKRMELGIGQIPEVFLDNTDRNRTSPFAFTGNRFEFRGVGSSANCASAMIALNTVVAAQLRDFKQEVDAKIAQGQAKEHAIFEVIKSYIAASKDIRFDGNGYGEAWKEEAKRRGLNCESSTPVIIDAYTSPESIKMFGDMHVFSEKELHARNEVKWEIYSKKIQIESRVLNDLALNHIIPVSSSYQAILLDKVMKMREVFPSDEAEDLSVHDKEIIRDIARNNKLIKQEVDEMRLARKAANRITNDREKAIAYHNNVLPYLQSIRQYIDNLESIVDDEMWPLPKYRELLFIR